MQHTARREKTKGRRMSLHAAIFGADGATASSAATSSVQLHGLAASATNDMGSSLQAVDLGKERRTLHQQSPWIVHLAPCMIEVPTGGAQAKHELQMLTESRVACQPKPSALEGSDQDL